MRRGCAHSPVLIQYKPVVDDDAHVACWYATGTDIEDRKRAENKLRQDERELRQLMDALPQHVLVLDKQGALLQANRTMLDYKGYTLEEMKGVGTRERIRQGRSSRRSRENRGRTESRPFK